MFADNPAVIVKRAVAAHPVKLMVTLAGTVPPGAMFPSASGNEVPTIGLHAAPLICCSVKLVIDAEFAAPGPVLPMLNAHTRLLLAPLLLAIVRVRFVVCAVKFAVTFSVDAFIVMVVGLADVLDRSALPLQFENTYPAAGVAVRVTTAPGV